MKPVRTEYTNAIFKLPGGTDENDLPVEKNVDEQGRHVIVSTWELSEGELEDVIATGKIQLVVWGEGHPPIKLVTISELEEK